MSEKLIGIKKEYQDALKWVTPDFWQFSKDDQLPQEIKEKIGNIPLELKKLEDERDQLVIGLYKTWF